MLTQHEKLNHLLLPLQSFEFWILMCQYLRLKILCHETSKFETNCQDKMMQFYGRWS